MKKSQKMIFALKLGKLRKCFRNCQPNTTTKNTNARVTIGCTLQLGLIRTLSFASSPHTTVDQADEGRRIMCISRVNLLCSHACFVAGCCTGHASKKPVFDAMIVFTVSPSPRHTAFALLHCARSCRIEHCENSEKEHTREVIAKTTTRGDRLVVGTGAPIPKTPKRARVFVYNVCHQLVQTKEYREVGKKATQTRIWGWLQHFLGQPVVRPKPAFDSVNDCFPILAAFNILPQGQHASTALGG